MSNSFKDAATETSIEQQLASVTRKVARLEAVEEVKRLQNIYGYYMDLLLYDEVAPLFARECEVRFMGGIYKGQEGVQRLFIGKLGSAFTDGKNRPMYGRMGEHIMLQEVITVAEDGQSAKGRVRHLLKAGNHESAKQPGPILGGVQLDHWIEGGIYENEFVKEDELWKFSVVDYRIEYFAAAEGGWAHTAADYHPWYKATFPDDPVGPDELMREVPLLWPDRVVVPFHYPNPVTGLSVTVDTSSTQRKP